MYNVMMQVIIHEYSLVISVEDTEFKAKFVTLKKIPNMYTESDRQAYNVLLIFRIMSYT